MQFYRKPVGADATGDAIPFYHDGRYHIFSLTPPNGTGVYPDRLRTTWSHAWSENLVDWEETSTALAPGVSDEPDADGCWTGSVIHGEGQFHAFYTGYNIHARFPQTICHATSRDAVSWTKDPGNPRLVPRTDHFESLDWRDPYVFFNEDERCYWLILSGRRNAGPITRRGCIVLYRSSDLKVWEYYGPIYEPKHTNCPECPEMYKMGDTWYLSYSRFSEFGGTIYRISKSPFGEWRTPRYDQIGSRRFYAAKSLANKEGKRYYFGWIHDRAECSDRGEWFWGGIFAVPHEVVQAANSELDVRLPPEIVSAFKTPIRWTYRPVEGTSALMGTTVQVDAPSTLAYGFFDFAERSFLMTCTVKPLDCRDHFGFVIKSDKGLGNCLLLVLERGSQRVSLIDLPMAVDPFWAASVASILPAKLSGPDGPRVSEKPFEFTDGDEIDIKILVEEDLVEVFVGERAALTYRSYTKAEQEIGVVVQDGCAEYAKIAFTK